MKKEKAVVRATKPYKSAQSTQLRLFSLNGEGHETLITTSSLVPTVAAARVCQLLEQPFTIIPSIESLKEVFWIPGNTAWASVVAPDAQAAALLACLQHDIKTAQGILVMITLSPDCSIVASIKAAMNVIQLKTPSVTASALVVAHDEGLSCQARVDVLAVGL